jgi:cell division protein FtsI/penicillin-binding protein 2
VTGRRVTAVLAVLLIVGLGAGAVWWVMERQERMARLEALDLSETFVNAWTEGNWDRLDTLTGNPSAGAGAAHRRSAEGLGLEEGGYEVAAVEFDEPARGDAVVTVAADLGVPAVGAWRYDTELVLVRIEERWVVDWSPSVVHPDLAAGQHLEASGTWPERAPLLDRDGGRLSGTGDIVVIGVEPRRMNDRAELTAAVVQHTTAEADAVDRVLDRPGLRDDWFYPITSLPRDRYDAVRDDLRPVPGLVFREESGRITGAPELVQVVGTVGEITAEQLEEYGAPYQEGDIVGQTGLERSLERQLAGSPGGEVRIADRDGETVQVLAEVPPEEPQPVTITLHAGVQRAAIAALDGVENPAALVAVDVATGEVRASVSQPAGGFDRALTGRYPPGSTMKVVTAAAALVAGTGPGDAVDCPEEASVGGRRFRNAGGASLGTISFSEAFAESCNTAFVQVARDLPDGALAEMAERFGFNADYGLTSRMGASFPEPQDVVELAAAGIGQGRVTATPMHMAGVAAAVARGAWVPPVIVMPDEAPEPEALPEPVTEHLPALMREVVRSGTGTAADTGDRAVYGKTGTAEYGSGDPPPTHAWFIGFSGDLAFAVLVEDGESGGAVAAPVAAAFLRGLPD